MTRKAIHDLVTAQAATASPSEAVHTRADAVSLGAAAKPPGADAQDQAGLLDNQAEASKQAVVNARKLTASASHATASVVETVKPGAATKASLSPTDKAGKAVIKPADRQDSRRDRPAAPHPSSSRQALKRRRSSSTSPSPVRAANSKASRGRSNGAGHADNSSHRRRTRCESHMMLIDGPHNMPQALLTILTALQIVLAKVELAMRGQHVCRVLHSFIHSELMSLPEAC